MNKYHKIIQAENGIASNDWRELWQRRELLRVLVRRDLQVRYKNTALGVLWVILQPLLATLIFTLVFAKVLRFGGSGDNYLISTMIGFVFWQFFSGSLQAATASIYEQIALVKKIYFPRLYLPLTIILRGLFDFSISAILLLLMIIFNKISLSVIGLTAFILVTLAMTIFTSGLSFIFASLNARYRDFRHLAPFVVQLWLYATPVFYPPEILTGKLAALLQINPVAVFLNLVRQAVFTQNFAWPVYLIWLLISIVVWWIGFLVFKKMETEIVDWT